MSDTPNTTGPSAEANDIAFHWLRGVDRCPCAHCAEPLALILDAAIARARTPSPAVKALVEACRDLLAAAWVTDVESCHIVGTQEALAAVEKEMGDA